MPAEVVLWRIYAAIKTMLAASAPLTALLGVKPVGGGPAIYDDSAVPQAATGTVGWRPYITVGAGTQISRDTMGVDGAPKYGYSCTLQVKGIGQISEAAGLQMMSAVYYALRPGAPLTIEGYQYADIYEHMLQPPIVTTQAGVVTREWPAILRVECHD